MLGFVLGCKGSARKYMVHIKALSDETHKKLVGWVPEPIGERVREQQAAMLAKFDLDKAVDHSEVIELPLPDFDTYKDVLTRACDQYGRPNFTKLTQQLALTPGSWVDDLPNTSGWLFKPFTGTGQYGATWVPVEPPSNQVMVLDIENIDTGEEYEDFGKRIKVPVCVVALSLEGLWVWLWNPLEMTTVIPFGRDNVITGHNISYDRQFLDIEYYMTPSGNVFNDTMSMWIPVHGMGNQQLLPYLAMSDDEYAPGWMEDTTTNGLDAIFFYYFGTKLDKGVRDDIVAKGYNYVLRHLSTVVRYCYQDVVATLAVFKKLYLEYKNFRPSPTTRTAAMLMGSYWCPMSAERFPSYFETVEGMYKATLAEVQTAIDQGVRNLTTKYLEPYQQAYEQAKQVLVKGKKEYITEWLYEHWVKHLDKQLQCLDWEPIRLKLHVEVAAGVGRYQVTKDEYRTILVPGWLHKHLTKGLTMGSRETVFILRVTYRGYKVLWKGDSKTGRFYTDELGDLPNPEDRSKRVCQLFTKSCQELVKPDPDGNSVLSAEGSLSELIVKLMSLVNWKAMRKRVYHLHTEAPNGYPVFLPLLAVNGAITGRCTDRFTQVMPNPKRYRLGTGIKSLIEAPKGYKVLGGDISSQELCISAWLGDLEATRNYRGMARPFLGSCPLSVAVMTGTSATKTDVHSVMAVKQGLDRDTVKSEVYGALYGQQVRGCTSYLMKNMPTWSESQCTESAKRFTTNFVGRKDGYKYIDGLASETFNNMHRRLAQEPTMPTPVFKCAASTSLTSAKRDFTTTKINRIVQASGADWRDALVVLTTYLFDYYRVRGRLMLTIHDEIRTIVDEEDVPQASYCLMLAHVYSTALFIDRLGLDLVPASKAWFEELDCTQHLSKAWNKAGECPEYPNGLPTGTGITAKDILNYIEAGLVRV